MIRKVISIVTLLSFILYLAGCHTTYSIPSETVKQHSEYKIAKIVTISGEVIKLSTSNYPAAKVVDDRIEGFSWKGDPVSIPFSEVKDVYILKIDPVKTFFAVIGVTVLVGLAAFLIALSMKQSCPFVYSWDGEQYVFDGEPYGGAICEGLKRTDLCKLEHLKPVDGEYRLLLTNEVDETQCTDEFKLLIVDHPPEVEVVQDAEGAFYTLAQRIKPLQVVDAQGEDLSMWLSEKDLLLWESDILSKNPDNDSDLRDTIYVYFPILAGSDRIKLVVHGSNTLWGSQMLKKMAEYRGDQLQQWYESWKDPLSRDLLDAWNEREELYHMQVHIWTGQAWERRGEILGSGPFIAEERVVPLDLTGVETDTLLIRLAPPAGFWRINSFAVDYSEDRHLEFQELSASSIISHEGKDIRGALESTDGDYYVMPEEEQIAYLTFPVPETSRGLSRTVFARVTGYYDIHLETSGPPQYDIIQRIAFEPGYVVRLALREYQKWRAEHLRASND